MNKKELPSLAEMQTMKKDWLDQCSDDLRRALIVARELGEEFRPKYSKRPPVKLFSFGRVHFMYGETVMSYLPAKQDTLVRIVLMVFVGDETGDRVLRNRKAAHFGQYNYDGYKKPIDNFAVPGQWQEIVAKFYDDAASIAAKNDQIELERQKMELARQLWLID